MRESFTSLIRDHLDEPAEKRTLNEKMFSVVASKYDFITRVLSLGRDGAWKRRLIGRLPAVSAPRCLDLACGTGDLTFLLAERYPSGLIVGVDLTNMMLTIAESKRRSASVRFLRQDMGSLGFRDGSVDVVTGGYALRNAPDLHVVLEEIRRVLKPRGRAAFLDFSKSPAGPSQAVSYWILKIWGGLWGILLHGDAGVYAYIAESLRRFPDRNALRLTLKRHGLEVIDSKAFFFGMAEMLVVTRGETWPRDSGIRPVG